MQRPRTLRARLFVWFVGAILLAIATSSFVGFAARPEPITGAEAMAAHVGARLADEWDDAQASRAYVAEVRDVTGFEVRLLRDPARLPPKVHHAVRFGRSIVQAQDRAHHIFVPVVRQGVLLGALEMEKFGPRPAAWLWLWWQFALALALTSVVLSLMAGGAANHLARPLEQLAFAADRFGAGDLKFRATPPGRHGRWAVVEVRDVAFSFNRMADRVEAMVRGQRELLGAISHELRSPLGRARVALEIARERLPSEGGPTLQTDGPRPEDGEAPASGAAKALDDIDAQLTSVDAILADLLDVTRAGLADLRRTTQPFVAWIRARVAEEPTPPVVELDVAPECDGLELSFDAPLLGRAVHNLLVNARAHGHPEGAPVSVRLERRPQELRLVVRDRGPGFPEGLVRGPADAGGGSGARAFEPFVRGDAARSRPATGPGYGLGLAIVRRIVEAHGGRAFARNADGGGAEVGFDLPLRS
jgi:signal transduction histidine kinase